MSISGAIDQRVRCTIEDLDHGLAELIWDPQDSGKVSVWPYGASFDILLIRRVLETHRSCGSGGVVLDVCEEVDSRVLWITITVKQETIYLLRSDLLRFAKEIYWRSKSAYGAP